MYRHSFRASVPAKTSLRTADAFRHKRMTNVMTRASLKWYVCSHVYPRMPWHMCLTAVPGEENKGGMRTWYIPTYDVRSNRRADERRQKKKSFELSRFLFLPTTMPGSPASSRSMFSRISTALFGSLFQIHMTNFVCAEPYHCRLKTRSARGPATTLYDAPPGREFGHPRFSIPSQTFPYRPAWAEH